MNLVGDAILAEEALELGLVNRVVPDHELFETALMWGRKLAAQAPIAVEQIKRVSAPGRPRRGHRGREAGLRHRLRQRGRQGGHRRLPRQAHARSGAASRRAPSAAARLAELLAGSRADRRADRGRGLGAVRDPRLPHPGDRALGERRPDGGRPHRRLRTRPGALLVLLPAALPLARRQTAEPRPRGAGRARAPRSARGRDHPEHRPPAPRRRLARTWSRCTARSRPPPAATAAPPSSSSEVDALFDARRRRALRRSCGGPVKPDVVLFGELLPEAAMARAQELAEGAELMLCVGSSLAVHPVAGLPAADARARRPAGDRHQGPDRPTTATPR